MCYVHNQWYDISCATLYVKLHGVASQNIIIVTHNAKRTPTSQMMFEFWIKIAVLSQITVEILHNNYTFMKIFPISAI